MAYLKKALLSLSLLTACCNIASAHVVKGKVLASTNKPVADVVVSCAGSEPVRTDANGVFTLENVSGDIAITLWHNDFYERVEYIEVDGETAIEVYLTDKSLTHYNETSVLPSGVKTDGRVAGVKNINSKDFTLGALSIEKSLQGELPGLQVTNKSGMTGEGAYMQLRGIKSFVANNEPLIVINGVPYMPDTEVSQIIGGYSRSVFQALSGLDIRNITVLTGSEAAIYGSMGSNGVIMIETAQASSSDMDTRITFSASYGFNKGTDNIPLMNAQQYKSYLSDMGLTYYDNMESFFKDFTFLTDPNANQYYLYNHDTNWQDEITQNSNSSNFHFRVEGGDNIAKYNIALGYQNEEGTLKNTESERYHAQLNASVLVNKKFEIQASINMAYLRGQYQEQSINAATSPLMAAYKRSPLLNPRKSDMYGNLINTYSSYWYGAIENRDFVVSNPLAIVNTLSSENRQYDINSSIHFIYKPLRNLTVNGVVGLYYNYNQEETFVPGINNQDIAPTYDQYGQADNSVRVGTNHTFNMHYGLNALYDLKLGEKHDLSLMAGAQVQMNTYEYDAAFARNSNNDFYQTLGDAETLGRYFSGYNNKWNWLNFYAQASYTYDNLVRLSLTAAYDGASSIGKDTERMSFYPAAKATFMAKQLKPLAELSWLSRLDIYAGYASTGNSRFSSKLGKYYYTSKPYQTIAGIVRANIPNTNQEAERANTIDLGLEADLWGGRLQLGAGYYTTKAENVLITGTRSAVLGTSVLYNNDGKIKSSGIELSLSASPVYTNDFKWTVGGTLSTLKNEVEGLGELNEIITTLDDDAQLITRVGADPYSFYGYTTKGVFSTTADAEKAALANQNGVAYQAGDVWFDDKNDDHLINDADKVILGSATPDFYGSFFTNFTYRQFALDLTFAYSVGNDAYNAVRRVTESGMDFSNQSTSMLRRWSMEGQQTDIPRASYGDQVGNNIMSDRWIEDASFLKLRNVTFSYTWDKPLWNFLLGGTAYITAENLFCITDYLGSDPEFSYSYSPALQGVDYGKVGAPKSVRVGVNLRF